MKLLTVLLALSLVACEKEKEEFTLTDAINLGNANVTKSYLKEDFDKLELIKPRGDTGYWTPATIDTAKNTATATAYLPADCSNVNRDWNNFGELEWTELKECLKNRLETHQERIE